VKVAIVIVLSVGEGCGEMTRNDPKIEAMIDEPEVGIDPEVVFGQVTHRRCEVVLISFSNLSFGKDDGAWLKDYFPFLI